MVKTLETNFKFLSKWRITGKVQVPIFQEFFATIGKIFILGGKRGTRLPLKFRDFPDNS